MNIFHTTTTNILNRIVHTLRRFPLTKKYIDMILQDKDINELTKGSSIALVFKLLSLPLGLATSLIISRRYGAEAMGLYGLTLTVMGIVISIGMLGLGAAMPRFLGQARAEQSGNEQAIYRTSVRMILLSGLIASGVLYFCSSLIAIGVFDEPKLVFPLQIASLCIIPLMIYSLNTSFLLAAKKIYHSELITKLIIPLSMLSIIFLSYRIRPTYYIPIWAYILTGCLGMVVSLYILWKYKYVAVRGDLFDWRAMLKVSGPILLTGLSAMIVAYTDILMLGWLSSTSDVGIYKVIHGIALLVLMVLSICSVIFGPKIAELYRAHEYRELKKTLSFGAKIIFRGSGLVIVSLLVFATSILGYFGAEFIVGSTALYILIGGYVFNVLNSNNTLYLNNTGREKIMRNIIVCWTVANIFGNYILIPRYGVTGAALSTACTTIGINICVSLYIWHRDQINFISLPWQDIDG